MKITREQWFIEHHQCCASEDRECSILDNGEISADELSVFFSYYLRILSF